MNTKTQLVNDIKCQLLDVLTVEQVRRVEDVIHSKLENYELQKRCTDVTAIPQDSSIQMLQKFIISKKVSGLSDKTTKRYYQQCSKLLYAIGKPINEIEAFDIRSYLVNCKIERNVSNRTLSGMLGCYSSFFGWCYAEELIDRNPCLSVESIKYDKVIKLPFSDVELEMMRCACGSKRDRALIEFLYVTGCRVSEVVQLDRDSVNFRNKTVLVFGKGNKERIVYLTDVALMYLSEYLESREDCYPALFIGRGTDRLSKDGIEHIVKRIGDRAGVEDAHPHRFRRTLATNLIKRGAEIQKVQQVLGHESISTTRIYCYIGQEDVREVYYKYIS